MTLKTKVDGAWKEASSLKVKINGEWKDVATLYSKKDGVWITVYSSGALIEFADYPYPIPVASGWKYSIDGKTWTTVSADGEINTSGTFTGYVKAKDTLTLNDYYTEHILEQLNARTDGEPLSVVRGNLTSFVNGSKGYVCGGQVTDYYGSSVVDVYNSSGTRTTGTPLSVARYNLTSFVNSSRGYVCGGFTKTDVSEGGYTTSADTTVDVYDIYGARTTGKSLSAKRQSSTSFVNNSKGYVCGGSTSKNSSGASNVVDIYDSSGNITTGTPLSAKRTSLTSFVNGSRGFVCGGGLSDVVDIYDSSGNRTTGSSLSVGRGSFTSFVNNSKGYVCGGSASGGWASDVVDVYNSSGTRTTGTPLSFKRYGLTSFANNSKGYVCGGQGNNELASTVDIYDSSGNMTTDTPLSVARRYLTSFVNNSKGYVCGGSLSDVVDIYYDIPEVLYTKLPITEGSTYTLNGESGVADVSKIMEFDSKVSGTITYKKGTLVMGPYDLYNAYYIDTSIDTSIYYCQFKLANVYTIDASKVARVELSGSYYFGGERKYSKDASSTSDPNGNYMIATTPIGGDGASVQSMIFTAYDADGNVLQTAEIPKRS